MKIENSFTVDASVEDAWRLLTDIPEIAPCLPGAKLTGEENGVYTGSVKVKVGPVTAEYKGTAEFVERDDAAHKAVINGKGRDTRGAGNAQALISAAMEQVGEQTRVDISTDLKISGKVAQFGRGVMQDVSEKLLGQFAECLAGKLVDSSTADESSPAVATAEQAAGDGHGVPPETSAVGNRLAEAGGEGADAGLSDARVEGEVEPAAQAVSGSVESVPDVAGGALTGNGHGKAHAFAAGDEDDSDDDALDLLEVAGGAVLKRIAPLIAAVVVIALIIWLIVR